MCDQTYFGSYVLIMAISFHTYMAGLTFCHQNNDGIGFIIPQNI